MRTPGGICISIALLGASKARSVGVHDELFPLLHILNGLLNYVLEMMEDRRTVDGTMSLNQHFTTLSQDNIHNS